MKLTRALAFLGIILMLSTNAFAHLREDYELNLFGAASIYSSNSYTIGFPQVPTQINGQMSLGDRGRFGARFGVYARGHWGQEFYYSYESNILHISATQSTPFPDNLHLGVHNYGINALYYLVETEEHNVMPFLGMGIGGTAYLLSQDSKLYERTPSLGNKPDMNNSNELTFNVGVGLKTRWNHFGIRLDARDYFGRNPSFGLVRSSPNPAATVLPATGAINNAEFSGGIVIYFTRR